MKLASGLTVARGAIAWRTVVSIGVVLAVMFLVSDASSAATTDPPAGTWTPVSSPGVTGGLASVSCVSSTDCWAVGTYDSKQLFYNLMEHWNGDHWTTVSTPDPLDGQLSSIDCVSSSDCWSVGARWSSGTETSSVIIEHWNGTDWSIAHGAPVNGFSDLNSVTCVSSAVCWAVGGKPGSPLAEHWNGSTWSVVPVPDGTLLKHPEPTGLVGVSCVSAEDCWAVGNYVVTVGSSASYTSVFEHWNGSSWSATTTAQASEDPGVTGIACVSSSDCWAVGSVDTGSEGNSQTLTERWNGTRWSIVKSANTSPLYNDELAGVTCTSAANCWAVGAAAYGTPTSPALTEHWNGSAWSIVPSTPVSTEDLVNSVTCTDARDCWSVGQSFGSTSGQGLVEWLVRPSSISIRPASGPPGTHVTIWGVGFAFDKPVTVTYESDVSGKAVETNLACNASTTANGVFSCKVSIPVLNAGLPGPHTVTATGGSAQGSTSFDLTG
jgi:hypothetical protein